MKGDVDKAFDTLFATANFQPDKSRIDLVKAQARGGRPLYGKGLGYELAIEKPVGSSVVRLVYIMKMEKHALVWDFIFYRPSERWGIANITFNDQFQGL